jgi:hypothetical protein
VDCASRTTAYTERSVRKVSNNAFYTASTRLVCNTLMDHNQATAFALPGKTEQEEHCENVAIQD